MAKCGKCGAQMAENAQFCKACGNSLKRQHGVNDEKKERVLAGSQKRSNTTLLVGAALVLVIGGAVAYGKVMRQQGSDRPMQAQASSEGNSGLHYATVEARNGEVQVPISGLQAGAASYFVYKTVGKEVKFFVLRASDGSIRAALDACQACYHAKLGYRQSGDTLICNNCGMGFKSTDVGHVTGGCSPIPLRNSQDGKTLVVKAADLETGVQYF